MNQKTSSFDIIILILKKFSELVFTLFLLGSALFWLVRFLPGSPYETDASFPASIETALRARFGLHLSLWEQYLHTLSLWAKGDLGFSFHSPDHSVTELLAYGFRTSFALGGTAFFMAIIFSIVSVLWAYHQNERFRTKTLHRVCNALLSFPPYLIAAVLLAFFSDTLRILPPGLLTHGVASVILPITSLAARPFATLTLLLSDSLAEETRKQYVRTAKAKGLPRFRVLWGHILRNALTAFLASAGPIFANLVTGSFVIESIFQIPGIGQYFVSSVINRDYPMIQGVTLLFACTYLLSDWITDLAQWWNDPRRRELSI